MKIVYLTAGAGGMFCGSCMHDNTLVRAMSRSGVDVQLVPTYTPIRTDEESVAQDRVFFGGINVYLQHRYPWVRKLPGLSWFLDRPWLIKAVASRAVKTNARDLGALTVDMLRGSRGTLRAEIERLCAWLSIDVQPDIIVLSNLLIGGCLPDLRTRTKATLMVTLQGDDLFLNDLPEPFRTQSLELLAELGTSVDGFVTNSRYYSEFMSDLLSLRRDRVHVVPLGIDVEPFANTPARDRKSDPPTIGYLARLAPEKGLHILIEAFIRLRKCLAVDNVRLRIAGWLGGNHQEYANELFSRLRTAGLEQSFEYLGTVDQAEKVRFLQSLDLFSVPTTYREPKGLFVLESLASGVPVVQPNHGAFPEMLQDLGGGELVEPNNPERLADTFAVLLSDRDRLAEMGSRGRANVLAQRNATSMSKATMEVMAAVHNSRARPTLSRP